jgi:hypothetical protein
MTSTSVVQQPLLTGLQLPVNTNGNRLLDPDRPVHEWYRFVLSYPAHLVRDYLGAFDLLGSRGGERPVVLDPFCGTGTTLVECKKLGVDAVGIEATPMGALASTTKSDWSADPFGLREHSQAIAVAADQEVTALASGDRLHFRTLSEEQWRILSPDFISPVPLHKTLTLLAHIRSASDQRFRPWQQLALAKALISGIGNVQFGPEIGCTPPKDDAPVIETWLRWCETISLDLELIRHEVRLPGKVAVHRGDSRRPLPEVIADKSVDAVITSPPYPNEKDYTRTTRLESVVLGMLQSKQDLRELKANLLRSNTRNVFVKDDDHLAIMDIPEIVEVASQIEARRLELGKTSGFERMYHRVTLLYFGGMHRHLADLRRVLKPGAQCAYVVGDQASYFRIMIRTGELLARVAERLGYEVERIDLFRTRRATATGQQLREEAVILRWPGSRV